MSSSANVLSIQALEDLKVALTRFGGEAQDSLNAAAMEIRRTLDWLAERQQHWQNEVRRRQELVAQARAALARCQASGYYDRDGHYHAPDCSAYENALLQAQRYLAEAEAELRTVREWTRLVQQAVADYEREAQRLAAMLRTDMAKATALLGRKIAELHAYLLMAAPGGSAQALYPAGSGVWAGSGSWQVSGNNAETSALQQALARLEGTEAGRPVAEAIRERGTAVRFGETERGAIAQFDPRANEIVISQPVRDASPSVLSAHLAHEGAHVKWNRADSIDQEYHAFSAQAEVWNQLKGSESDEQCDVVSGMIALGERGAKRIIRRLPSYRDLPEYA